MTWITWVALAMIVVGVAWLCAKLYDPKSGAVGCCGCGECIRTGECVMVKKKAVKKGNAQS